MLRMVELGKVQWGFEKDEKVCNRDKINLTKTKMKNTF